MDREAYLEESGLSEADWEQMPVSVKRLLEVDLRAYFSMTYG